MSLLHWPMFLPAPVPKLALAVLNWRRHVLSKSVLGFPRGGNDRACVLSVQGAVKLEELVYHFTVRGCQESVIRFIRYKRYTLYSFHKAEGIEWNQKLMLYARIKAPFPSIPRSMEPKRYLVYLDFFDSSDSVEPAGEDHRGPHSRWLCLQIWHLSACGKAVWSCDGHQGSAGPECQKRGGLRPLG